jgi:GNAT superfamily N-acetyltransferase
MNRGMTIDLRTAYNDALFERAYRDILEPNFPHVNQLESKACLRHRLLSGDHQSEPLTHLLIRGEGVSDPALARLFGVIVLELYRESGLGLVTYIATASSARRQGIGALLFREAQQLALEFRPDTYVLAEVANPQVDEDPMNDQISPWKRLKFFASLGGEIIPIPYVQPPLSPHGGKARSLVLMAFPNGNAIAADRLRLFLDEFYRSLRVSLPSMDPDFQQSAAELERLSLGEAPAPSWRQLANEGGCPLARIRQVGPSEAAPEERQGE